LFTRPDGFQKAVKLPRLEFLCWYHAAIDAEIRSALSRIPESRTFLCRYEDLVSGSTEILRLAEFLQVEPSEEFLKEYRASIRKDGVGRYRDVFSASEIEQVSRILARRPADWGPSA
jgi:hypothetical protein